MRWVLICLLAVWAGNAVAQTSEDDRDFITGLIEDSISNDDMTVRLENFQGALSSEATADAITISDPDGVWLRLDGLTIQWNRSALLSGRVEVDQLSADRIELIRLPLAPDSADLPSAEATPFTLPELPVSVELTSVSATEIVLTEALLGEPVVAQFQGALSLIGGAGNAQILLERSDNKQGRFDIDASYTQDTRQLALLLLAEEGENGIAARLLDLPDRPAVRLEVSGDAPLDDFVGNIALATDNVDRITGTVQLSRPSGTLDQAFAVDLQGDLRPLLASQYDSFFGANTVLKVEGTSFGVGGLRLSNLIIGADQLVLRGSAAFDAQGWPEAIDLRGRLGSGGGGVPFPAARPDCGHNARAVCVPVAPYVRRSQHSWQAPRGGSGASLDGEVRAHAAHGAPALL
jgi:translocation and assembly module TamB